MEHVEEYALVPISDEKKYLAGLSEGNNADCFLKLALKLALVFAYDANLNLLAKDGTVLPGTDIKHCISYLLGKTADVKHKEVLFQHLFKSRADANCILNESAKRLFLQSKPTRKRQWTNV